MTLLKIGADPFPPYQYYDEEGRIKGSDYEKVLRVLTAAGYEVDVFIDNWKTIEERLQNKELNGAFQVQMTPSRTEKFFFSDLLRNAVTQVITNESTLKISRFEELLDRGLSIGVIENYSYGDPIDRVKPENKVSFASQEGLLEAISKGEVKIGIFDKGVKEYLMDKYKVTGIYSLDNLEFIRPLYVIFNDQSIRDDFNKALTTEC